VGDDADDLARAAAHGSFTSLECCVTTSSSATTC
jgi:hypothetical protein